MTNRKKTSGPAKGAGEYEIGFGKPPVKHQFKPNQSGNPKGRAPGSRSFRADLEAELRELVQVSENGQTKLVTKQLLVIKSLINKAVKGDSRAAKLTIDQIAQQSLGQKEASGGPAPLSATDDAILQEFLGRRGRDGGAVDD